MSHNTYVKKILVLAANPTDTDKLRLDEEVREIDEGLRRANMRQQFKLEQKWAVRSRDFYRSILDEQPQIVHFSGHGAGQEGIVLEDDTGQPAFVHGDTLSSMFEVFATTGLECVLLNACYSEVQAQAISQHINYVIGMNRLIGDRAAINFAVAFYDTLGAGKDIESAFKMGCSQLISLAEHETPVLKKRPTIVSEQTNFQPHKSEKNKSEKNSSVALSSRNQNNILTVEEDFHYDVYVSYIDEEPDATWVWDTLLPRLEQAGLRIAVSGDVETPGVSRVVNIEQGITQSKRTLVVLSEAYLADGMAEFENVLVQTMGIQENSYRLLPVKLGAIDQNCLPTRLSMLTILDLVHPRRAQREFDRLVKSLQEPLPRR
ncbi:TIR domain-containing protein [Scytonema sp. PCC 10023]|uniref:TIR domain-containing protein n=1 Tax=Scytonema sp. PCC 10023 TaxID=1680591 RepID=UPI0039C5ADAB